MKKNFITLLFILIITGIVYFICGQSKSPIKIAFFGDSITDIRWQKDGGYVIPAVYSLNMAGYKVIPIYAGKAGNTTTDMLRRMDYDVIQYNPDVVFFMGGINDVWKNRVEFDQSKQNISEIINRFKQSGIKLIVISVTLVTEDVNCPKNKEVDRYNEFLKEITAQNDIQYIDVNKVFKDELKNYKNPSGVLTTDGIHLNKNGNRILAQTLVKEFIKEYKK